MRSFKLSLSLTSLLALCLAVCTIPGSNAQCTTELGCPKQSSPRDLPDSSDSNQSERRQFLAPNLKATTNADRLSRGLPLLPPTRRSSHFLPRAPRASPVPTVTYRGRIQVSTASDNTVLGFVTPDPNYWTPLLSADETAALLIEFTLPVGATSGTQLQFQQINDGRRPIFGFVVGRDSTDSNIASGSFNYLYLDPVSSPGTPPGSTPLNIDSFFSASTNIQKDAETSVWSVDLSTGLITAQWINTDGSSPATQLFAQSNHLYGGGDSTAFQSRFPAPVTIVQFTFDLVSMT